VATYWSWQLPIGPTIIAGLLLSGFMGSAVTPLMLSLPMLLPEIGPVYAGSAGGIISTMHVLGAVLIPTFVITPLAGPDAGILFGLAAVCFILMILPVVFLPELGAKALAARARSAAGR
jgi:NNP family nitrate/nitrite transporter-like MFS transporter